MDPAAFLFLWRRRVEDMRETRKKRAVATAKIEEGRDARRR